MQLSAGLCYGMQALMQSSCLSYAGFADWTFPVVAMPGQEQGPGQLKIAALCGASKFKMKFKAALPECWVQRYKRSRAFHLYSHPKPSD